MHYRRLGALLAGSVFIGTLLTMFMILQTTTVSETLRRSLPDTLQRDFITMPKDAMDSLIRHQSGEIRRRVVEAWSAFRGGMAVALALICLVSGRHGSTTALVAAIILVVLCIVSGAFVVPQLHDAMKAIELQPWQLAMEEHNVVASVRLIFRGLEIAIAAVSFIIAGRLVFDFHRVFGSRR